MYYLGKLQLFSIITMFLCMINGQRNDVENKLNILVLYESLCPDSINFMISQLGPNYGHFKDLIDIELVPFGKSYSINNGASFYCQHGPYECLGNRVQSCVLNQLTNDKDKVNFATCHLSMASNPTAYKDCVPSGADFGAINECIETSKGSHLQLNAEKITNRYQPAFVPTIIYDKIFDQHSQDNSIANFRATLCHRLLTKGLLTSISQQCKDVSV